MNKQEKFKIENTQMIFVEQKDCKLHTYLNYSEFMFPVYYRFFSVCGQSTKSGREEVSLNPADNKSKNTEHLTHIP